MMFSDQSHFELRLGNQATHCRRLKVSDRFSLKFTRKTVKHPQKVMVWGCFSWKGRGRLGVPGPGKNDEWHQVLAGVEGQAGVLHASVPDNTFSAGWGPLPHIKNCDKMVRGLAHHPAH
jgi:hypothetical protein